jgi:hypothetical protein
MKIINILEQAKKFTDRYSVQDSIKIAIHSMSKKLIVTEELQKNIPELCEDLEYLINIYKDSDKVFKL